MTEKKSSKSQFPTRRKFIRYTGYIGTLFSTTSLSSLTSAQDNVIVSPAQTDCQFSQLEDGFIYLNSGTEGSMPDCVLSALQDNSARWASNPTIGYETDEDLGKHQHVNREKIASFLSVEKNNITLTDNTTMGLSMVLMGLNFKSGDKVVLTNHEHNAIASPVAILKEKLGLEVHIQSFPYSDKLRKMTAPQLIDVLFPDTEKLRNATALCVTHVYPTTGVQLPLNLLRKKANELGTKYLIVDGAQAFGMLDISGGKNDISQADFYACPGHKWLNGPPGTGILYLKNASIKPPEFYPVLSQRMGKYSIDNRKGKQAFPMAEALQVRGCSNTPAFVALQSAVNFIKDMGGPKKIEEHIMKLSALTKDVIVSQSPDAIVSPHIDPRLQSGLTVFHPFSWKQPHKIFRDEETSNYVVNELSKENIRIRSIGFDAHYRPGQKVYALRVSTGIFNNMNQLNYFAASLEEVLNSI